jgi:DNA repair photolyase
MIVFCTKNPIPIVDKIEQIKIPIIFHTTLTPYHKDIEPNVPPKGKVIESVKQISEKIGKENMYIRYDPLFISDTYTIDYHIKAFNNLCKSLKGYTKHIIISFLDDYKNVRNNYQTIKPKKLTTEDYKKIGENFSKIAKENDMTVQTCFEKENLAEYGFINSECMGNTLAKSKTGKTFKKWASRKCGCVEMVDIASYNTCMHLCKYCYANYDEKNVIENRKKHDPKSTMLIGHLEETDKIKVRKR